MNSTSSSKKLALPKEKDEVEREDRISSLPIPIISQILSLRPTIFSVATSALSTKWKEIWKTTPVLHLDDEFFRGPPTDDPLQWPQFKFTRFVYWVLLMRDSSRLHKLYLKCDEGYDALDINAWIAHVVKCNIEELHFSVQMQNSILLPKDLFSCRTLVKMKLGERFVMNVPSTVSLPRLRVLEIDGAKFSDDNSISRFFSGCPALEQLSMRECIGVKVEVVRISAPVLRSLIFEVLPCSDDYYQNDFEYEIQLETPMLSYLYIDDHIAEGYEFGNLAHLAKAHVGINRPYKDGDQFPQGEEYRGALNHLFEGISGVQLLHLTGVSVEAIQEYNVNFPVFDKLTSLSLGVDRREEEFSWNWLISLLENLPHLRSLTFEEGLIPASCYSCSMAALDQSKGEVPACLLLSLKTIEIHNFLASESEIEVLGFFMRHAKVLEKFIIYCAGADPSATRKLTVGYVRVLPRASIDCRFLMHKEKM